MKFILFFYLLWLNIAFPLLKVDLVMNKGDKDGKDKSVAAAAPYC